MSNYKKNIMNYFDYQMAKHYAQMKRDLDYKEPSPRGGCIWTIVGILLIIALLKYLL